MRHKPRTLRLVVCSESKYEQSKENRGLARDTIMFILLGGIQMENLEVDKYANCLIEKSLCGGVSCV